MSTAAKSPIPSPEPMPQEIMRRTNEASRYPLTEETYKCLGSEDLSFDRYFSQDIFDQEIEKVWKKVWQWACREEHIPEVGDYVTYDIGDYSVIVVRSAPDTIKGFYNSCLHRGTKLCPSDTQGSQPHFNCPYHGWVWNLDGTLKEVPSRWDFDHVNDADFELPEVRVETWGGFVFINFDPDAIPLLDYLAPLPDHFQNWDMENRYTTVHIQKELPCNWKAAAEAFMENYHTVITHPQLMPSSSGPNTQYDICGQHLSRFYCMQGVPDPALGRELSEQEKVDLFLVGDGSTVEPIKVADGDQARPIMANYFREYFDKSLDIEVGDLTDGEILDTIEYTLFPNMFLFPGLSLPMVYRFRPIGNDPNKSLFDLLFLRPIPRSGERPEPAEISRIGIEDSYSSVDGMDDDFGHVYDQDTRNLGLQQEGFKTAYKQGQTLGNYQEIRIRHMHQTLDAYLARES